MRFALPFVVIVPAGSPLVSLIETVRENPRLERTLTCLCLEIKATIRHTFSWSDMQTSMFIHHLGIGLSTNHPRLSQGSVRPEARRHVRRLRRRPVIMPHLMKDPLAICRADVMLGPSRGQR
jgi:hypothetical protein